MFRYLIFFNICKKIVQTIIIINIIKHTYFTVFQTFPNILAYKQKCHRTIEKQNIKS